MTGNIAEQHAMVAGYNPARLVDALISHLNVKNDAALARVLDVLPPVVSNFRHNRIPLGASLLIRMHDASQLSIAELRSLCGERRRSPRPMAKSRLPAGHLTDSSRTPAHAAPLAS